jgi:hypothetical protein
VQQQSSLRSSQIPPAIVIAPVGVERVGAAELHLEAVSSLSEPPMSSTCAPHARHCAVV